MLDLDRMVVINASGVQEIDSHVAVGINLDVMMAIDLGLVEDSSEGAVVAVSDGLMGIDSVVR